MDSITHGLLPFLAGKFFKRKKEECAALLLGGLAPDFDVFIMWIPLFFETSIPFVHRGITHTFIFGFITAAIVLFIASRKYFQKLLGYAFRTDVKLSMQPHLVIFAYVGTLSHLSLDWLTTYGIALFYPFSINRFAAELFFFIDFYLMVLSIALVGYYIFLKGKRKMTPEKMQSAYVKMFLIIIIALVSLAALRYYEKGITADYFQTDRENVFPSFSPFEWRVYDVTKEKIYVFDSLQKKVTGEYAFSGMHPNRYSP